MLSTSDLLNISLAVGFLIFACFAAYFFYCLALTLKTIREVILSIKLVREGINVSILTFLKRILGGRR